jgi:hypothetical protein
MGRQLESTFPLHLSNLLFKFTALLNNTVHTSRHKDVCGSVRIAPRSLNLDTRWRWVLSFTPRTTYPREKNPGTHCTRGWVGPTAGLDVVSNRKIPPSWEIEPRSSVIIIIAVFSCYYYYYFFFFCHQAPTVVRTLQENWSPRCPPSHHHQTSHRDKIETHSLAPQSEVWRPMSCQVVEA